MTTTPGQDLPPLREIAATINAAGTLRLWGVGPTPTVEHHLAIDDAYNELVNLLARLAAGPPPGIVLAAIRTPDGPWHIAVGPDARTIPWDATDFTLELPELTDDRPEVANSQPAPTAAIPMPDSLEELLPLLLDPREEIRAAAAAELTTWCDDSTPVADAALDADLLDALSESDLSWVRTGVAANPGTASATLARLAEDDDRIVRQAVAARFDLEPEITEVLARDAEPVVRAELGRNPAAAFLSAQRTASVAVADPEPEKPTPVAVDDQWANDHQASHAPSHHRSARTWRLVAALAGLLLVAGAGYATLSATRDAQAISAPAAATVPWNGMSLPTGSDGPDDPAGPVASGFAHTELGAALAAAHLSVRIDPYAGPASFVPTITEQTFGGDSAALLSATQDRYDAAAARTNITDGSPIPTSTGEIDGWRIDTWSPDAPASVHLLVTAPGGERLDYKVDVVWVDGDYRLIDPTRADQLVVTSDPDASTYRSF